MRSPCTHAQELHKNHAKSANVQLCMREPRHLEVTARNVETRSRWCYGGPMDDGSRRVIELLGLERHPEGGWFRETFRARAAASSGQAGAGRVASTAIYFLLTPGGWSAFHTVSSDEVWHHYDGATVEIHTIDAEGRHTSSLLGHDLEAGERPQLVVPAGTLQAARPVPTSDETVGSALCGCTVAPGFAFDDFDMPSRASLVARYPRHEAILKELTYPDSHDGE